MNNFSRITNYSRKITRKLLYPAYDSICINRLDTPQKVILLLSHMRAGSTLCVNLLCTNPEIIGMGETGIRYSSERDFRILRGKVYSRRSRLLITERYLLDNLNHNFNISNPEIFFNENVKCIFLLRDSESTLSSLLNEKFIKHETQFLTMAPKQIDWKIRSSHYYRNRLAQLTEYAKIINNKEKSLYFTYEQLISDTQATFNCLKSFLDIQDSFSDNYAPLSSKGIFGLFGLAGDPVSKKITSGKIIRKKSPKISLPSEILTECLESYQNANATLSKYCRCIGEN
ncbi:MAG: sulfotransferase domain-containing protein [Thiomargarita sp.]|nr:sulfotransferase domain-containing protein [Thiomargarita sp.]